MWTPAARAQLARDDIPYATSLTDQEWAVATPFMSQPARTGRTRLWPMRLVFDGIQHVLRTGCTGTALPCLPPADRFTMGAPAARVPAARDSAALVSMVHGSAIWPTGSIRAEIYGKGLSRVGCVGVGWFATTTSLS